MHHLYAAGFNAWNQLNFDQDQSNAPDETPKDLHTFTQVLEADTIERPIARLSFTIGKYPLYIVQTSSRKQIDECPAMSHRNADTYV